jgi:hypothetical protein
MDLRIVLKVVLHRSFKPVVRYTPLLSRIRLVNTVLSRGFSADQV